MMDYLIMMVVRLIERKQILKSAAAHSLKTLFDAISGKQKFQNETI